MSKFVHSILVPALALLAATANFAPAKAADMRAVQHYRSGFVQQHMMLIEGDIREGDYKKFLKYLLDHPEITTVELASKGGNITEAMKIGETIRTLYLETAAPAVRGKSWMRLEAQTNAVCASACFFIFVAGVNRSGYAIGIHRPYLSTDNYKSIGLSETQSSFEVVKKKVGAYLTKMNVPTKYFDIMISARPEELRWLTVDEIQQDFMGYIPGVHEFMNARCQLSSEDERAFNAVLARIPPERQHMGMSNAIVDPKDKAIFEEYARKMEGNASCRQFILVKERIKVMQKMLPEYHKLLKDTAN